MSAPAVCHDDAPPGLAVLSRAAHGAACNCVIRSLCTMPQKQQDDIVQRDKALRRKLLAGGVVGYLTAEELRAVYGRLMRGKQPFYIVPRPPELAGATAAGAFADARSVGLLDGKLSGSGVVTVLSHVYLSSPEFRQIFETQHGAQLKRGITAVLHATGRRDCFIMDLVYRASDGTPGSEKYELMAGDWSFPGQELYVPACSPHTDDRYHCGGLMGPHALTLYMALLSVPDLPVYVLMRLGPEGSQAPVVPVKLRHGDVLVWPGPAAQLLEHQVMVPRGQRLSVRIRAHILCV